MIELENVFKPKKRVFVSLTLASAVLARWSFIWPGA